MTEATPSKRTTKWQHDNQKIETEEGRTEQRACILNEVPGGQACRKEKQGDGTHEEEVKGQRPG